MPNRYERERGYDVMRLEEKVRAQVLEKYSDWNVDGEWWGFTYEDARRMGALMGIDIDDICFSGFWSQGDGASFTGKYSCEPNAVEAVTAECGGQDPELIRIATELTQLQVTWKLRHGFTWECSISRASSGGNYYHSKTMQTGWSDDDERYELAGFVACSSMDLKIGTVLRDFADWIYSCLEKEYEYLTSEEVVVETIRANDLRFSSSGDTFADTL